MGEVFRYCGPGGVRCLYIWHILQSGCLGNPLVWIRYLGDYPQYRTDPHRFPPQDGLPLYGYLTTAQYGRAVGVSAFGGGNGGRGAIGGLYVRPPPPEHHSPIHCDLFDIGDLFGVVAADGSASFMAKVVESEGRSGGHEGGGKVDGVGSGGGGIDVNYLFPITTKQWQLSLTLFLC